MKKYNWYIAGNGATGQVLAYMLQNAGYSVCMLTHKIQSSPIKLQYQKEDQDRLVEMNDNEFKKRLDKYKYHVRFPDNALEDYRNDIAKDLELYDERLLSSRYMLGEKIQLADIALMPFIRQCAHVDLSWFNENFENLSKWLISFKESKLFISIMTKHKVWDQASEGILINWDGINQ